MCENIYIGPVNVSGMTKKEAKIAMQDHLEQSQSVKMTMLVDEKTTDTTLRDIELNYQNIDKVVDKAMEYGKKGTLLKRYRNIRKLQKEKLVLDENLVVNEEKLQAFIKENAVPLANHAVDATLEQTSSGFSISEEKEGMTVAVKKSIEKITKYLNEKWNHKDFEIKLVQKTEKPSVKAADLETIQDELGTYSTDAGGGERWKNLETGVGKVNGTVLMPGEEASVHALTAPYDAEHGYVAAGSYENGQVVETYGGGICQVSSTLYNALLYAEIEIVERYPHSMLVSYVDPSRDAAIAGDYKDLVFKNNYDTPIYIAGGIDSSNRLRFTVYGKETRAENRKVEYESETISTDDYGVVYKEDPEASLGSQRYGGSPHTGREARLWKVVYEDGTEVSREAINSSSYQKSDQIIYIGTKSDNASAASLVRSAIGTQDSGKINAAIAQAGGM
ncbi:MAG: VanW family protein [Dorea sp.]